MLSIEIKVNKNVIIVLSIRNIGIEESYRRGLEKGKRYYHYECNRLGRESKRVLGEIIHDREDGPLVLVKKVIEDIELRNLLDNFSEVKDYEREIDLMRIFWGFKSMPLIKIDPICGT